MRANTRRNKPGLLERFAIDHMHAIDHHVSDIKSLAVGRDAHVLRHAWRGANVSTCGVGRVRYVARLFTGRCNQGLRIGSVKVSTQFEGINYFAVDQINLGDRAIELAGKQGEFAID